MNKEFPEHKEENQVQLFEVNIMYYKWKWGKKNIIGIELFLCYATQIIDHVSVELYKILQKWNNNSTGPGERMQKRNKNTKGSLQTLRFIYLDK